MPAAGISAGLSHSPVCNLGKERYVFFSFPHIGIDSDGSVGIIHRPGRSGASAACGALIAALKQIKATGLEAQTKQPGVHDPLDPEFSILKQRLARRIRFEGLAVEDMDLVQLTKVSFGFLADTTVVPPRIIHTLISKSNIYRIKLSERLRTRTSCSSPRRDGGSELKY